jgi:hypothetical protein
MRIPFWRTRTTRLAALVLGALAATGATCKVRITTGTLAADGASFGACAFDLVGTWRRIELFTDTSGVTHSQEIMWTFATNGEAALSTVTRNLNAGLSETTVRRAHYRAGGGEVVIDFEGPEASTVVLPWRIDCSTGGSRLLLGTRPYDRVA